MKPKLKMVGEDGNVFAIIGRATRVLRENKFTQEDIKKFQGEMMSGDYDNALRVCMEWFEVN